MKVSKANIKLVKGEKFMTLYEKAMIHYKNNEYDKAVNYFFKLAEEGDTNSKYYLGICYRRGLSIEEEPKEAFKWFMRAAEEGHANAQYEVANSYSCLVYMDNSGVEPDQKEAFNWYKKSAEQGHSDAQFSLASCYQFGDGVEEDSDEASKWLLKAAEQNHAGAMLLLGHDCEHLGNIDEAIKWYQKATEFGDEDAPYKLGELFEESKDYENAFKWYKIAIERQQRSGESQYRLGVFYQYGYGIEKDYEQAVKWYKEAGKKGHKDACFKLVHLILYEKEVVGDVELKEKIQWFIKAANLGSATAEIFLRACYIDRDDLGSEYNKKMDILLKAQQGNVDAQIEYGYKYMLYHLIHVSSGRMEEAFKWYKDAAEKGNADAQFLLSVMFWDCFDEIERINLLQKAADWGHSRALCELAECYHNGEDIKKNVDEAIKLYIKSAELGNIDAQINLGYFYAHGEMVEIDFKKSFKWYKKAIEQMENFDDFELSRVNSFKIRYGAGNDYAESKAIEGDVYAQLYLGCLYEHGFEIKQNYKKAFSWYEKAAKQGNKYGMFILGDFYKNGKGVEKNHKKASEWINNADSIIDIDININ